MIRRFLRRRPRHTIVDTEYGSVVLDEVRGRYWHLNDSALVVARAYLDGGGHEQAADALVTEFGIDREVADRDAGLTRRRLEEVGLL